MHHKSWSNLRRELEENRLCPALRGRVQFFLTRYREAHDQWGRLCIRVDGTEYLNACIFNEREYREDEGWHDRSRAEMDRLGQYPIWMVADSIDRYMDELSIRQALTDDDPIVRMLAVLDRRVGKRTLPQLAATVEDQPEWLRFFYRLRLEAEKYEAEAGMQLHP